MAMRILNVRVGHATNSSSSHSLVFMKDQNIRDEQIDGGGFGWQLFTAASKFSKKLYAAATLRESLRDLVPDDIGHLIVREWTGLGVDDLAVGNGGVYVDHQSQITLPRRYNTQFPDREFFNDFCEWLTQDGVVILGGNDNDGVSHPLASPTNVELSMSELIKNGDFTCRKDGDYWTLYSPTGGAKIRLRFETGSVDTAVLPEYADTPELVDLKITDFCPYGCKFCYQGSSHQGEHASSQTISNLVHDLADAKVFEVVIGGGEPTLHPDFLQTLRSFAGVGVTPNFTTRRLDWIDNAVWRDVVANNCRAFAYSWNSKDNYERRSDAVAQLKKAQCMGLSVNIHAVMGTMNRYEFVSMLHACSEAGVRPTLLGFKPVGRGSSFEPITHEWWIDEVKKSNIYCVNIDTMLAGQYEDALASCGVPRWTFETVDGGFSCYVDAVTERIGPSSYCGESKMQAYDMAGGKDALKRSFEKVRGT